MDKGIKTRICINCEGNMSFEDPFCPYCGQNQEAPPASKEKAFTPPYKLVQPSKVEASIPTPLYKPQELQTSVEPIAKIIENDIVTTPLTQNAKMRSFLSALILTMCGSTFLLFGLSLFLFGKEGMLTVHWKSSHWYLYLTLSIPLLFFGWRYSNRLQEPEES